MEETCFAAESQPKEVSLEECPGESFANVSADKCWEMVLNRLNNEISRSSLDERGLPPLQSLQSINGFAMFGFLSQPIVEAIEALDPDHQCTEYWNHRQHSSAPSSLGVLQTKLFGINMTNKEQNNPYAESQLSVDEMQVVLRRLLEKANPTREEFRTLHRIFSSRSPESRVACADLIEDMQSNVDSRKP